MTTTASNKLPGHRVLAAICASDWAITQEALENIIAIAERRQSDVERAEALLAQRGDPLADTERTIVREGVAVIPVTGPLFRYANLFTAMSGATSFEMLAGELAAAVNNRAVNAIVLDIDSPGGQVAGTSEFAEQVRAATAVKPVIAYVSHLATSAAYWIAAAASKVVIRDTGMVGSVGVVLGVTRAEDDGGYIEFVSSVSPRKRLDPASEAGRTSLQARADALGDVFVAAVAEYRGVTVETVLADFGQGDVLVGEAAVAAGMADSLGSLESVIAGLAGATDTPRGIRMNMKTAAPTITVELIAAEHPAIADHFRAEGLASAPAVTLDLVREKHPDVANALIQEGATEERVRIQAVQATCLPGHEQLVAEMMFDGKTSGPQAATRVLAAERAAREGQAGAIRADAAPLAAVAPVSPVDPTKTSASSAPAAQDLPLEERCKAEYEKDEALRRDFPTLGAYIADQKALAGGSLKIIGKR